jgi:serine/threonine protein kinase
VFKARDTTTQEIVAVKQISVKDLDDGVPRTTLREISVLQELRHPNIVELRDVVHGEKKLYLVFEFFNCDLGKYLHRLGKPCPPL